MVRDAKNGNENGQCDGLGFIVAKWAAVESRRGLCSDVYGQYCALGKDRGWENQQDEAAREKTLESDESCLHRSHERLHAWTPLRILLSLYSQIGFCLSF